MLNLNKIDSFYSWAIHFWRTLSVWKMAIILKEYLYKMYGINSNRNIWFLSQNRTELCLQPMQQGKIVLGNRKYQNYELSFILASLFDIVSL